MMLEADSPAGTLFEFFGCIGGIRGGKSVRPVYGSFDEIHWKETLMNEIAFWQGRAVTVDAHPVFPVAASINVYLDGECILRTGGQPDLTGSYSKTFMQGGSNHTAEVRWGKSVWGFSFPYELFIDGAQVAAARVQVRYAWVPLTIKLLVVVALWFCLFKFILGPALAPRHY